MEFIINDVIKIHPMALIHYDELEDKEVRKTIRELTAGFQDKTEYFVDPLSCRVDAGLGRDSQGEAGHELLFHQGRSRSCGRGMGGSGGRHRR